jgi:hypothetical protein
LQSELCSVLAALFVAVWPTVWMSFHRANITTNCESISATHVSAVKTAIREAFDLSNKFAEQSARLEP